jgi:heme/copper-type cytochrome/quinol oxidase subunit 3
MWVFLGTDAMGFGGLLLAYAMLRARAASWPDAESRLNRPLAGGLTMLMLASAATVTAGAAAARAGQRRRASALLVATAALGVAFLVGQYLEFDGLAHERQIGLAADHAASLFYVIAGYHGLHVLAGVALLGVLVLRGARAASTVQVASLYWQFVDVVWIGIYVLFYLLPVTS